GSRRKEMTGRPYEIRAPSAQRETCHRRSGWLPSPIRSAFHSPGDAMKTLFRLLAWICIAGLATVAHAETRFVLVSHAPDSDSWWNTIKNAIKQAGEDFGVTVDYRNPSTGDLADMARILEQAAVRNYDGVITSIADIDVLKKPIAQVVAKKIPLV